MSVAHARKRARITTRLICALPDNLLQCVMNWLSLTDQASAFRLNSDLRQRLRLGHKRKAWIWNGRVSFSSIRHKRCSVREVSSLLDIDMEYFYHWYSNGRFKRLSTLRITNVKTAAEMPTGDDDPAFELPRSLMHLYVRNIAHDSRSSPHFQSFPPGLRSIEFVQHRTSMDNICRGFVIAPDALPPSLETLIGLSSNSFWRSTTETESKDDKFRLTNLRVLAFDRDDEDVPVSILPPTIVDLQLFRFRSGTFHDRLPESLERLSVVRVKHPNADMMPPKQGWPTNLWEVSLREVDSPFLAEHKAWPSTMRVLRLGVTRYLSGYSSPVWFNHIYHFKWPDSLQRLECHRLVKSLKYIRSHLPNQWKELGIQVSQMPLERRVLVFTRI